MKFYQIYLLYWLRVKKAMKTMSQEDATLYELKNIPNPLVFYASIFIQFMIITQIFIFIDNMLTPAWFPQVFGLVLILLSVYAIVSLVIYGYVNFKGARYVMKNRKKKQQLIYKPKAHIVRCVLLVYRFV